MNFARAISLALVCGCVTALGGNLGGWEPLQEDSNIVQELSQFAVDSHNRASNSLYSIELADVTEAYQKVVAGMLYKLSLEVGQTDCRKNSEKTNSIQECHTTKVKTCTALVYDRRWDNHRELKSFECGRPHTEEAATPAKHERAMVGGAMDADVNSPEVMDAVHFAAQTLNHMSNSLFQAVVSDVLHVTSQVVAGTKYVIELEMSSTECRKVPEMSVEATEHCPIDADGHVEHCTVTVVQQVWMTPQYTVVGQPTCEAATSRQHVANTFPSASQNSNTGSDDGSMNQQVAEKEIHYRQLFENFKITHNKQYDESEESERFEIFMSNMEIAENLQKNELGTARYGPTEFADLTPEEFRHYYLTPEWDTSPDPRLIQADIPDVSDVPDAYDWRDHGAVTDVKNQGTCGSCWAFSTTGNIEGQWAIQEGQLLSLSEQELVDCDTLDDGCMGGLPTNAYHAIINIGGLETETKYPYVGRKKSCHFDSSFSRVNISGALNISSDEQEMAAWLVHNGPISIGINAFAMQFYFGGVSHPPKFLCNPKSLDHGVLIVGYGVKHGLFGETPYWIVKNSWGKFWGKKGYYLVYRGKGVCGLNTMCTSAIVE